MVLTVLLICSYLQNWLLVWCYLWHGLHPSIQSKTRKKEKLCQHINLNQDK